MFKRTLLASLLSTSVYATEFNDKIIDMDLLAGQPGIYNKNFQFDNDNNANFKHIIVQAKNLPADVALTVRSITGEVLYTKYRISDGEHNLYLPQTGGFIISVTLPKGVELNKNAHLAIDKLVYTDNATSMTRQDRAFVGADNRTRLVCHEGSDIFTWGRSALALEGGGNLGSASSIGSGNLFLTNEHVIGEPRPITGTVALFNNRHSYCEGDAQLEDVIRLPVTEVIAAGHKADYSFFKINEFDLNNSEVKRLFGGLKLAEDNAVLDQTLTIPQGWHKSIVATTHDDGSDCKVVSENNTITFYNCDTEAGSSGSPVLDRKSGEVVAVHAAATNNKNVGVKVSVMREQNPWLNDYAENVSVLGTDAKVKLTNIALSPFKDSGILKADVGAMYFANTNITIEHHDSYSLVYPQYLNERTNEVSSAAELNLPIKIWLESNGVNYPINKAIDNGNTVTLKYNSYEAASLASRAWIPLDMYNAQGQLVEHTMIRMTTNWFDPMQPPFDPELVDAEIETFRINNFNTVSTFAKPASKERVGTVLFYPEQGPVNLTWSDRTIPDLPVVIENRSTMKKEVINLTAYRVSCGRQSTLNSAAPCSDGNPATFKFEFHPSKNNHLAKGNYSGILPMQIRNHGDNTVESNILMNIDLVVPEMAPYSTVKLYAENDQSGEMVQFSSDVADMSVFGFDNKLSSYDIPQGYSVRFFEGLNFTGTYYTRHSSVGNSTVFDNIVKSVKVLQSPGFMKGPQVVLSGDANYFPGQNINLTAQVSTTNNMSLSYQWKLPTGYHLVSGENTASVIIATPKKALSNQQIEVLVTDGKVHSTAIINISSTPSLAPVLQGIEDASIAFGDIFNPRDGVSANDDLDGDITANITIAGSVDSHIAGKYTLTYRVQDSEGNTSEQNRIITVEADNSCNSNDPDATKYPAWQSTSVYTGGDIVSFNNLIWKAKYWTQGNKPSRTTDQWQLLSNVQLAWSKDVAYNGNDVTMHDGRQWQAKWWTKDEKPGVANVWEDKGAASCN
ncbi:immunoglobulin-like domain-containing protein [Aliivibrio sifiae]|uniref:Serine protease n=1 Tax=Aliivibrio sifiae TaxID=566293 RepID=A0A2S7X4C9_9GAMM|nr:immunoglobulin-like domain-containing protein [Aliivibrio sifiae]PQJ84889.1 hypothetical protein BTO22_15485 [Aliivibrio sifiae]